MAETNVRKLVLLPGMDGTGELLRPLAAAIGDRAETQVLHYPPDDKLTYPELIERIAGQIPSDGEPFVIVAESFAGPIGLTLAQQRHPGLAGLVLAVTFAAPPRKALLELTRLLPMPWMLAQPVPCWLAGRIMMGPKPPPDKLDMLCKVMHDMNPDVIAARFEEVRDFRLDPREIELPVMYIQATDDLLLPESAVDEIRQWVPQVIVHRLEGGHLVLDTQPERAADLIADFMQSLPRTA